MRLSIRWRLTCWSTLAFATILTACGGLIYGLMRHALFSQVDRRIDVGYHLIQSDPRMTNNRRNRLEYWIEEFDEHQGLIAAIADDVGTLVSAHETYHLLDPVNLTAKPALLSGADQRWRGSQRTLRLGGEDYRVTLIAPLLHEDAELATVRKILLLVGGISVVATAIVSYGLARAALRPIEQIQETTASIGATRLHHRLPVNNPHDELGRLSLTINAMIERLETAFEKIRRFTADASHELRTPITVIRTEAEVAISETACSNGQEQIFASIVEECDRMGRLTEQLLTLAREDASRPFECSAVNLTDVLRSVLETLAPLAESKHIHIKSEIAPALVVRGDPQKLRQVFVNLVENAIKYSSAEGRIHIAAARVDDEAEVVVEDEGIGIPAEHLPRIFERFYRVDKARSRDMGGTGLGLSIAEQIVAGHHGTITARSQLNVGSAFTVRLPTTSTLQTSKPTNLNGN
jgi:heavy metal sensor kinase